MICIVLYRGDQPLWHYEDITAKVWSIRSGEQLDVFLQHILRVFHEFLPHALISERWAQTAIQLGLSCSSRHYAGRSLQVWECQLTITQLLNIYMDIVIGFLCKSSGC